MSETTEQKALRWVATGRMGTSSKAILAVMTGNPPKRGSFCYPHDADDLSRCLALLEAVPEWKGRMREMAVVGEEWAALAKHWEELTDLHANSHDRVHARMREILEPIEKRRPGLLRLTPGVSAYFGDMK